MPVFSIELPDKRVLDVEAADEGTALRGAKEWHQSNPKDEPPAAQTAPAKPDIGYGAAFMRGAHQGITANFGDELSGLRAAAGTVGQLTGFPHLAGAARLAYEFGTGQPGEATKAYEQARNLVGEQTKEAQKQYPGTTIAGEMVGGIASVPARLLRAATLAGRIGRGAAVGAGYGGAAGLGEGEGAADRLAKGATGAAGGAIVGAVAPPLVEGAIQAGRGMLYPLSTTLRSATSPEGEAARRVVQSLGRDAGADPGAINRLTPQEFGAERAAGGPATIMDMGGETTRALARSAANTSPEGRGILNRSINDRFEGQSDRLGQWFNGAFHYPNAEAQQRAIEQTARQANNTAYTHAYQQGAGGVWSPGLERLAGSDAVSKAMQTAASKVSDEAIVSGYGAANPRIMFTPDGRMQFNRAPNGMPTYPDLQYWDIVRRELSDKAMDAGRHTAEGRRLGLLAQRLNAELDQVVPSYAQARQTAAHFFGADNALTAGQEFVGASQRFGIPEARQAIAQMSPTERQLFQDGYTSRFIEMLNRTGDRRNVLDRIGRSNAAREELNVALGPQRANELEARLRVEGIMDHARTAVQGNSTTARQIAELTLAGGAGGYGYLTGDWGNAATVIGGALVSRGHAHINGAVAQRVAEMLVSNDPQRLTQGIRLIARNHRMLDNLRAFDQRIGAAGAQQTTAIPALQGPMRASADQEQP